jgi:hypothetical protein
MSIANEDGEEDVEAQYNEKIIDAIVEEEI